MSLGSVLITSLTWVQYMYKHITHEENGNPSDSDHYYHHLKGESNVLTMNCSTSLSRSTLGRSGIIWETTWNQHPWTSGRTHTQPLQCDPCNQILRRTIFFFFFFWGGGGGRWGLPLHHLFFCQGYLLLKAPSHALSQRFRFWIIFRMSVNRQIEVYVLLDRIHCIIQGPVSRDRHKSNFLTIPLKVILISTISALLINYMYTWHISN